MKKFKRRRVFYVYILECQDGTYYTGYTNNLENRIRLHNKGIGAKYTRNRRPVKLVWYKEYKYYKNAFLKEKEIKKLTRKQKEELVKDAPRNCVTISGTESRKSLDFSGRNSKSVAKLS